MPIQSHIETMLSPRLCAEDETGFRTFTSSSRFAAYQQSLAWANHAPSGGRYDYLLFLCRRRGETIGAGVVRRTKLAPFTFLATLQRGPVVAELDDLGPVLKALKRALKEAGCCTVIVGPRARGEERDRVLASLSQAGFSALPNSAQSLHVSTGLVDLRPSEEAILAAFKQRGRRQVRAAAGKGVGIRSAETGADIAAYEAITAEFMAGKPAYDRKGQPDARGQAAIVAANGGGILLAELNGEVIGGHSFVVQGKEAIWLSIATSNRDPSLPRSYLLVWEAMRMAKRLGCQAYDLAGMVGSDPRDRGEANREQFKQAFAPSLEELVPAHLAALDPVRHAIFFSARQAYRRFRAGRAARARD